jgi:alkylation response protein AidB-like acyl-CoA dehydrogenase
VPDKFTLIRDDPATRRETGALYAMTVNSLYACGFAAIALGLARSLLDAFVALTLEKTPRGAAGKLRDNAVVQSEIGMSEARLRGARMYLLGTLGEVWDAVRRSHELPLERRIAIRLAASHATTEAIQVADTAYRAAGATAIFDRNPFERRFRDIHAVSQQVQARRAHFETVGRLMLGLDGGDTQFV